MKFEHTQVFNFEGALRGMRNPLESWNKSDSKTIYMCNNLGPTEEPHECNDCGYCTGANRIGSEYKIGANDLQLAQRLINGGSEHRKFLRQIMVSVDITAPLYFYKEFDTYKIGTVANSTSTMHKIMSKPFTLDMFEIDDYDDIVEKDGFETVLKKCNSYRDYYISNKDYNPELAKVYWKALIRILPESWLQTRTVTMNYEILRNIVHQRANHKLTEWHSFIRWVSTLPYAEEFIFYEN